MKTVRKILGAIWRAYARPGMHHVSPWPLITPFAPWPWRDEPPISTPDAADGLPAALNAQADVAGVVPGRRDLLPSGPGT